MQVKGTLLFVCSANVCRSPLMQYAFRVDARRVGTLSDLRVISRGTDVARATRMCTVGIGLLEGRETADASVHRSRALSDEDLEAADLIITASRAERSIVARRRPDLRTRTFTLREAVALGAVGPLAVGRPSDDGASPLRSYAETINARRGTIGLERPARRGLFAARAVDAQDVYDAHDDGARRHLETLRALRSTVFDLHLQLGAFIPAEVV